MNRIPWRPPGLSAGLSVCFAVLSLSPALSANVTLAQLDKLAQTVPSFEVEAIVQAAAADLEVLGYSIPTTSDWNNDGLFDLIVGEGGYLTLEGKVRVYLNEGSSGAPDFTAWGYAQGPAGDLVACLDQRDRRVVVDRLGVHRLDDRDVVDDRAGVRQEFAEPRPALAVL